MSTRVEFRWPDSLVAAVDAARGDEPRSAFVRRHIEQRVTVNYSADSTARAAAQTAKTAQHIIDNLPPNLRDTFVDPEDL